MYSVPRTHTPPPPTSIHGRGGRVEPERRGDRLHFTKLGRKYQHGWMCLLNSDNSDKHLAQSPFTGQYFYMTFFIGVYYLIFFIYLISP
jgi:hypothetical protein